VRRRVGVFVQDFGFFFAIGEVEVVVVVVVVVV
jgi:hypothetical protein